MPFDVDGWVRDRFAIYNAEGGKAYERGVRKIDCPFCGDTEGHGWVNTRSGVLKCFRVDCEAHGRGIDIIEAVRAYDGFTTRTEAILSLRQEFPPLNIEYDPVPDRFVDWCELPKEMSTIEAGMQARSPFASRAVAFAKKQWGVPVDVLMRFGCGYCVSGRFANRIIFPIKMGGRLVGFQGRVFFDGEPRYLTSRHGARGDQWAECGRPADAMLFNLDAVQVGGRVLLVEGLGDTLAWEHRRTTTLDGTPAVAILGSAFGFEKATLLMARQPKVVVVGLDTGATEASNETVALLQAWGADVEIGTWVGAGKDPGEGAELRCENAGGRVERVRRILRQKGRHYEKG